MMSSGVSLNRPSDANRALINRFARRNTLVIGPLIEPLGELAVGRASGLNPARACEVDHHLPLGGGHPTFRPRHFQDRHERQQLHRFGRESQLGELAAHFRIGDPDLLAELAQLLLDFRPLPCFLDELTVLFLEIVLFLRALPAR